jgi:hypothetical protein
MATLTIDASEHQEGEFTAEEMESLQIGEALANEEQQLLAGKFRDAEDLEQAYIELQRKLGNTDERVEQAEAEEVEQPEEEDSEPADLDFLEQLWQESLDDYSEETLQKLEQLDAADLAQMYLEYRAQVEEGTQGQELSEADVSSLKGIVGGDENYEAMMGWAQDALNEQEINMYDAVMEKGDPLACFFAVQALKSRFLEAQGYDGQMLTGTAPKAAKGFRSQAELVRAMNDPRYDSDPAYRADVAAKLEVSELDF